MELLKISSGAALDLRTTLSLLDHLLNVVSDRRHKLCYPHQFMTVVRDVRFVLRATSGATLDSTRSVEGRGDRIKRISRRIVCWRRAGAPPISVQSGLLRRVTASLCDHSELL